MKEHERYRQASPGEPYRRFLGERVEASPGLLRRR